MHGDRRSSTPATRKDMHTDMTMLPERRWAGGKAMCIQRRARWACVGMTVEATA